VHLQLVSTGDTGSKAVTETDPAGHGFLADVVVAWEGAAGAAREAGIRVVYPRTGLVVSADGGAWARMFPLFKAGVGGKLGSGKQYWSWISMRDELNAIEYLLNSPQISGAVNLTAPEPQTNAEITSVMGKVLGRPTLLPAPAFALKIVWVSFQRKFSAVHACYPLFLNNTLLNPRPRYRIGSSCSSRCHERLRCSETVST